MDFLPIVLLVLFVAFLVGIVVIFKRLKAQEPSAAPGNVDTASDSPPPARTPTPAGANLETMRLAVAQMETDHIENLLDMGATLKPGTEELFRAELAKRRPAEDLPEDQV